MWLFQLSTSSVFRYNQDIITLPKRIITTWRHTPSNCDVDPMLFYCWASVADARPTIKQHWINVSCLWRHTSFRYSATTVSFMMLHENLIRFPPQFSDDVTVVKLMISWGICLVHANVSGPPFERIKTWCFSVHSRSSILSCSGVHLWFSVHPGSGAQQCSSVHPSYGVHTLMRASIIEVVNAVADPRGGESSPYLEVS